MTIKEPSSKTILVVDDVEGTRFVFSNWLRRVGHEVHEATSGAEALEMISRIRFDLVLLDVHLPDMTGFEVCDHIKSSRATATIPVLHVSATATGPDARSAGLNRGADGYLTEPVDRDELIAVVAALLRYHEARQVSDLLARRLEQLHQTALLIHAAPTLKDLVDLAATGVTATFGVPCCVLLTHNGLGWAGKAFPNELSTVVSAVKPSTVREVAETAALAHGSLDLGKSAFAVGLPTRVEGRGSCIRTPRGELVGAVVLLSALEGPQDDLILDHLSQTLAVAVENHRLYDVEHQIAITLQHAMLPESLPEPEGLEIQVRYQSASATVEIGGDFYEVIELAGGTNLLVVGDVVGHSLRAATTMAELRYSLRTLVAMGLRPSDLLGPLNSIFAANHPDMTATLCMAEIDVETSQMRVTNAGHVPPLVRHGGQARYVTSHGPLLGLPSKVATPTEQLDLEPDTLILLTTDGLVERRDENIDRGLEWLRRAVLDHEGSLAELCDSLLYDVQARGGSFDDIAILAARISPSGPRLPKK